MTAISKHGSGFETPVIRDFGSLVDLTVMMSDGERTDATFPQGTPKGDITFS
jgi:hypothetical protein